MPSTFASPANLQIYAALSDLPWPKSYYLKIMMLCFVGTHIPLVVTVVASEILLDVPLSQVLPILALMLVGTIVAGALTVFLVRAMLAPLAVVSKELERYRQTGRFTELPNRGSDEAADLMRTVNTVLRTFTQSTTELEIRSNTDSLIGIGNRRWLLGKAQALLTRPPSQWAPTTVAIIDLDHFKAVNDTAGHAAGDEVLKRVGEILVTHSRPTDLVGRLGGDEFCIIFPRCDIAAAEAAVHRMRTAVAASELSAKFGVPVTLSAGLTYRLNGNENLDDTMARADHALYAAKTAGRNTIEIALPDEEGVR